MSDAYIVGVDMIKFGRFPEKTVPQLGAEAALLALDDCGLAIQDMQALYCGNLGQASGMVGQRLLQEIGQTGIPVVNVANACATGATAFREAWASVKAGLYDVVLAVGVEQSLLIIFSFFTEASAHLRLPLSQNKKNSESGGPLAASICCSSKYCDTLALMASLHCRAQMRRTSASAAGATSGWAAA